MSTTAEADPVNHPRHYKGDGVECIHVIENYDLGFHLGNAVKYLVRAGRKGDAKTDTQKAIWYVRRWLDDDGLPHPCAPGIDEWMSPDKIAAAFGLTGACRGVVVAILDIALDEGLSPDVEALGRALDTLVQEAAR